VRQQDQIIDGARTCWSDMPLTKRSQTISESRPPGEGSQNALLTFSRLELSVQELVSGEM